MEFNGHTSNANAILINDAFFDATGYHDGGMGKLSDPYAGCFSSGEQRDRASGHQRIRGKRGMQSRKCK